LKDFAMKSGLYVLAAAFVVFFPTTGLWAQPHTFGPTNDSVLLPPQTFDDTAKGPNNTREHYGEWSIWGGVYLMQPEFGTNPAFLVNSAGATRQVDFSHNLDVAPFVGLAYVSERGWGIRGRWFEFDHGASSAYAAAPAETITGISPFALARTPINGTITASSNLAVNVFDIEATCSIDGPKWWHLLGFGVRYAHMSQDYRASLANNGTHTDLTAGHNLNSVGPMLSLEAKRRIGESGFAVYGQMHGAILFGNAKDNQYAVVNGVPLQLIREESRVLPVGELEVGAEYSKNVGRASVFVQVGFVGQIWWGGGNASNLEAVSFSSTSNSNFGFIGLALRAGVRY
jgi:hypothetical protein